MGAPPTVVDRPPAASALRAGAAAVARRLAQAALTALGASLIIWALLPLAPGDPARRYLQVRHVTAPSQAELEAARAELGLDRPWVVQYGDWLAGVVRGDLGTSYSSDLPVTRELADRFPATLRLAGATLLLAFALALPAGVAGAAFAGRWPDGTLRALAVVVAATPAFVIALALIEVLVIRLGVGRVVADGSWDGVLLPAVALAPFAAVRWSRLLRAGLLDALGSGYALVARARGARRLRVIVVHCLPTAALPVVTAIGLTSGYLLAGDVVVETVFSWPGVGQYVAQAVANRDLPVIQGFALIVTAGWVAISLMVDLAGRALDPRGGVAA
jgi:ABC-type dipeptide/oligopeptide/nickel transport system permease component